MNALFVNQDLDDEHLGIMVLSSILENGNHNVDIVETKYTKAARKLKE